MPRAYKQAYCDVGGKGTTLKTKRAVFQIVHIEEVNKYKEQGVIQLIFSLSYLRLLRLSRNVSMPLSLSLACMFEDM